MNENLRRNIILEHYEDPLNKGLLKKEGYLSVNMDNESCIDQIDLEVLFEADIIKDIRFDGEACAICTSSTSIMIETLLNKTITEAKTIIKNFDFMINEIKYDKSVLGNALVYSEIYKQPNRKTCALLPWWGMEKIINIHTSK